MPYNKYRKFLTGKVKKPKSSVARHKLLNKSTGQLTIENRNIIEVAELVEISLNETIDVVDYNFNNVQATSFFII